MQSLMKIFLINRIKLYLLKSFLIFSINFLHGQGTSSASGFVRNDQNGEPISYANVYLSNSTLGAATNRDGYFVISDIPLGKYEINVSMMGYRVYKKEIDLSYGEPLRMDIRMKEEVIKTSEVLVTAERQKFERSMES